MSLIREPLPHTPYTICASHLEGAYSCFCINTSSLMELLVGKTVDINEYDGADFYLQMASAL